MATLKQIAERLGVSTATVSYVLNRTKKMSPELTQRVMETAQELGYTPLMRERMNMQTGIRTIGVLVEDVRCFPIPDILCGIAEALEPYGYQMLMHDLHLYEKLYNQYEQIGAHRDRVNQGVSLLADSRVDGIIYAAMHDRHLDYLFDPLATPLVFAYSHGTKLDTYITYSNQDSAADMTRYLLGKGHVRIAVIAGHPHSYPTARRLHGIQMALQQVGLILPEEYIRYGNWEYNFNGVR